MLVAAFQKVHDIQVRFPIPKQPIKFSNFLGVWTSYFLTVLKFQVNCNLICLLDKETSY